MPSAMSIMRSSQGAHHEHAPSSVPGAVLPCGAVTAQAMTSSERADACLAALDETGRAFARRVVLRLVDFGDGRPDTRRRQPLSALRAGGDPERVAAILRQLTEARLLRIDGDESSGEALVDLAHEAQIASWPTLQAWIRTHGKAEQLRRQLETDAAEWRQRASQGASRGSDEVGLLDRRQLKELAAWLTADTRRDLGVSELAESFLAASQAAARRSWWPWTTSLGAILAILLILLILATPITLLSIAGLITALIHKFW